MNIFQLGLSQTKYLGKKVVREKINTLYRDEMLMRTSSYESLPRIYKVQMGIPFHPHAFVVFCREYPSYKKYVHLAVRLIWLMFCGRWLSLCHKCGENSISLVEYILLSCPSSHNFRNVLHYTLWFCVLHTIYLTICLSASELGAIRFWNYA